jgi:hypothetical protein
MQKEYSLSPRERARERGYKNRWLAQSYPRPLASLSPTLSLREREYMEQQRCRPIIVPANMALPDGHAMAN